ncbi:MAG: sigma-70 family RNA polymerase sigma factor [Ruminiclostridium sp.]|nr:sigma-70 family RNA polymerase sigma factor [Ruminiclostridium sp.]
MTAAVIDWETVYRDYEPKVRAYIQSRVGNCEDIKDLCSEVFLEIMRQKERFSGEPKALSSWIFVITKRTVAKFYRSYRPTDEIPEDMADDTDIEQQTVDTETLDLLADALEQLEERLRDIILLHYYGDKTLSEIATAMGMSYPNIKVLHKKALGQLRKLIE